MNEPIFEEYGETNCLLPALTTTGQIRQRRRI
ncbi:hypothetical protein DesyoDRAFT_3381 [Desulfosporosinus youngiae DSM 17734]|uniref:Uncharacterized protein n=1 Tax=Desulfosporosinus youngiae DSM 17734 TaxID=768710 RepID=H5Y5F5_9FIRM|nr:hypothetical protein DesyoDRAFT_3381 [Desulfosporosinus youngiae DSM 17734]